MSRLKLNNDIINFSVISPDQEARLGPCHPGKKNDLKFSLHHLRTTPAFFRAAASTSHAHTFFQRPFWFFTMDDTERRTAKRSRFDQTEPEPKRASRFDRRSRSPPARKPESRRSRSPIARKSDSPVSSSAKKDGSDPAAAAGQSQVEDFYFS
jgi:hypothetical protein